MGPIRLVSKIKGWGLQTRKPTLHI